MARRKTTTTRDDADAALQSRSDGWTNFLTGLGTAERDAQVSLEWKSDWRLGHETLDQLYARNRMLAKIIDRPAFDMTRRWVEYEIANSDGDSTGGKYIADRMIDLGVKQHFEKAIRWADLYGGAIAVMATDDGGKLETPLDPEKPVRLLKLEVFDRYQVQVEGFIDDALSPMHGLPQHYVIMPNYYSKVRPLGTKVHASRVLRFEGALVSDRLRVANLGWNYSKVDSLLPALKSFQSSTGYLTNILKEANIDVFQIDNLASLLEKGRKKDVEDRFRVIQLCKSILGAVVIGREEKYERRAVQLTGIVELLREFKETLSSEADIPTTLLWGRSPAGMNATGESDIRQYYDRIAGEQESRLSRQVHRVTNMLAREPGSGVSGQVRAKFLPLWQMTDKEKAEIYSAESTGDRNYIETGVVEPVEVAMSRFGGTEGEIRISEKLRQEMLDMLELVGASAEPAATPELGGEGMEPVEKAQDEVLAGVQLQAFEALKLSVATRQQPRETAIQALIIQYNRTPEEAEKLMGEIGRTFFIDAPPPQPLAIDGDGDGVISE